MIDGKTQLFCLSETIWLWLSDC